MEQCWTNNGICFELQVALAIRGRYVQSFWTANLEFVDKIHI